MYQKTSCVTVFINEVLMETKRDYNIMARGIYFDLKKMHPVSAKSENTVYFPSQGEYRCFRSICNVFSSDFEIKIHPRLKTSACDWVLDFKIIGRTADAKESLAKLVNFFNETSYDSVEYIFIEYKGFADQNFRYKYSKLYELCPSIHSLIILVASEQSSYTNKKHSHKRSVWSVDSFQDHCAMILK